MSLLLKKNTLSFMKISWGGKSIGSGLRKLKRTEK